jgi:hypothetical protein
VAAANAESAKELVGQMIFDQKTWHQKVIEKCNKFVKKWKKTF